jgi:hypothetical protein
MAIHSVTSGAKARVEGSLLMRPVGSDPVSPLAGSPGLNKPAAISGSGDRRHNGPVWDAMSAPAQLAPWSLRGGREMSAAAMSYESSRPCAAAPSQGEGCPGRAG